MVKVEEFDEKQNGVEIPQELLKGKRHLRKDEIEVLEKNLNHNDDPTWENFYVEDGDGNFDPTLIHLSFFSGFIILGKLRKVNLVYNDLKFPGTFTFDINDNFAFAKENDYSNT